MQNTDAAQRAAKAAGSRNTCVIIAAFFGLNTWMCFMDPVDGLHVATAINAAVTATFLMAAMVSQWVRRDMLALTKGSVDARHAIEDE